MDSLQLEARAFLRQALETSGLKAYALAKKAGVSATTITRPLNDPDYKYDPKPRTLAKIAAAAQMTIPASLAVHIPDEIVELDRRVPVIGEVRAGVWVEVVPDDEPEGWLTISIPEYERANLFALRVSGSSMNLIYADGTLVICAPAHEAGIRAGDHVVVRRRRAGTAETTLKEVVVRADGDVELQPRSSDPAFQDPILLNTARDADDGPEIIAVVVAIYALRGPRTGPLVRFKGDTL